MRWWFAVVLAFFSLASTQRAEAQTALDLKVPLGLKPLKPSKDNPLTQEKVDLGRQLFFDPRLSRDNTISCASCHNPQYGWSNGTRFAKGIRNQVGGRSAPTVINSAYQYFHFWDGRAKFVEGQALGPIQNPIEMDLTLPELEAKLNKIPGYREQFQAVFGSDATSEHVAKAIGAFERTLLAGNAPLDRHKAGEKDVMSEAAVRGMEVFFNTAQCSACHSGPRLTDDAFHNVGVGMDDEQPDLGRYEITKLDGDRGSFKTPTLRDIDRTAPYMHDGRFTTLEQVVDYYDKGGAKNPYLDEEIKPLGLSDEEKADLIVFLKEGLTSGDYPTIESPLLPE